MSENNPELTKREAAEFLGVSARTLERHTREGKLTPRYRHGKHGAEALYPRDQIEAFKARMEAEVVPPALAPSTPSTPTTRTPAQTMSAVEMLSRLIAEASIAPPPPSLWMSIDEAVRYTGIMRAEVERAVKANVITAQILGPRQSLVLWHEHVVKFARSFLSSPKERPVREPPKRGPKKKPKRKPST